MPNAVDLALLVIVALNVWSGWYRGFIVAALDLIRWIAGFLAAISLYRFVSSLLNRFLEWSQMWTDPLAFLLVLVVTSVVLLAISRRLTKDVSRETHERSVNKIFGLLPGLASGLITAAVVSSLLLAIPLSDGIASRTQDSFLANRLAVYTEEVESALVPVFDPAIRETLNRLTTIEPGSEQRIDLPYRVESPRPRPDLESQMLDLVNQERAAAGLSPVEADPELTLVARDHSADMFARGYFSHYTPENASPFDRIRAADVSFRTAGENLALAPTVQIAHRGLMNSPGHRANILRPQFGRLGIGILDGGRYGLMVTQKFRN